MDRSRRSPTEAIRRDSRPTLTYSMRTSRRGDSPAPLSASPSRNLLAVVVDGRGEEDSGLTLSELAEVLIELGAVTAMNLDGGGSSALVADGFRTIRAAKMAATF